MSVRLTQALDLADWPEIDRSRWLASTQSLDLLALDLLRPKNPGQDWRPATQRLVQYEYGCWLGFLAKHGLLDPSQAPAERVTPDRVTAYILEVRPRIRPTSVEFTIRGLLRALSAIELGRDWHWLRCTANNLLRMASKCGPTPRQTVPIVDLFDLGIALMTDAESIVPTTPTSAARFRDGLMISLLAARPIRLRNLAGIRIGRELQGCGGYYRLEIGGAETKNGRRIDLSWPDRLVPFLDQYLGEFRPLLLETGAAPGSTECALWVTQAGKAMSRQTITNLVGARTRKQFGIAIRPHHFRRCATTSIAVEDPKHVRIATAILGHQNPTTTERHYNRATTLEASRSYWSGITALHRELRRKEDGYGRRHIRDRRSDIGEDTPRGCLPAFVE